jgi:biotin carboxyl carrier protein
MSLSDANVASLVRAFKASGFSRLFYESDSITLNLHRGNSAPTPKPSAPLATGPGKMDVIAPRLGLLRRKVVAGKALAEGEVIAELDVLGVCHPVAATRAGRLHEWSAEDGSLIEWGTPIATLDID